jgi:hypothetical protein
MKKEFKIKAKVWKWPGDGPWHFVTLDKKMSEGIRKAHGKGMIRIRTIIGQTTWDNVLFPHKISSGYILAVKKMVRKEEDIMEGDEVMLRFIIS